MHRGMVVHTTYTHTHINTFAYIIHYIPNVAKGSGYLKTNLEIFILEGLGLWCE